MSLLLQDIIVTCIALTAAATAVHRSWSAFSTKKPGGSCGSCGSCGTSRPAANQPQVHELKLITRH